MDFMLKFGVSNQPLEIPGNKTESECYDFIIGSSILVLFLAVFELRLPCCFSN